MDYSLFGKTTKEGPIDIENDKLYPVCPKCNFFPFLYVSGPNTIQINCRCGYEHKMLIKEYFNQLTTIPKCSIFEINCIKHPNTLYTFFCDKCNLHLCSKCMNEGKHSSHSIINLNSVMKPNTVDITKELINKGNNYLEGDFTFFKNNLVSKLRQQINRIQYAFEESKENNKQIIYFLELLVKAYSDYNNNYYILSNIEKNSHLQIYQMSEPDTDNISKESIDKLVTFYKINSIFYQNQNKGDIKHIENPPLKQNNKISDISIPSNKTHPSNNTTKINSNLKIIEPKSSDDDDSSDEYNSSDSHMEIKPIKEINHNGKITYLLLLKDGRLAASYNNIKINNNNKINDNSNDDNNIILYYGQNFENKKTVKTKKGGIVSLLELENGKLLSSTKDGHVEIININGENKIEEETMRIHQHSIPKMIQLAQNIIITCSSDHNIKISNILPFNNIKTLIGHAEAVRSIYKLKNENILVSGSNDDVLIFWNIITGDKIYTMTKISCRGPNTIKEFGDKRILVGTENIIFLIKIKNKNGQLKFKKTKFLKNNAIGFASCIEIFDNHLIMFGCKTGKVLVYNTEEKREKLTDPKHPKYITSLIDLKNNTFATAVDGSIKLWEY